MNCDKSDLFHQLRHLSVDTEESDENTVRIVGPWAENRTWNLLGTGWYIKAGFICIE
jgi:hypothetical protein